jgi:hypothetical protein
MAEPVTLETIAKQLEECLAILAEIRADRERHRAQFPKSEFWRCYEEGRRNREKDAPTEVDGGD